MSEFNNAPQEEPQNPVTAEQEKKRRELLIEVDNVTNTVRKNFKRSAASAYSLDSLDLMREDLERKPHMAGAADQRVAYSITAEDLVKLEKQLAEIADRYKEDD